jgi:hypothetical protein
VVCKLRRGANYRSGTGSGGSSAIAIAAIASGIGAVHLGGPAVAFGAGELHYEYDLGFPAKYSGANSFGPDSQRATSRVLTLYTGIRLTETTDFLFDLETAGGTGLSNALGIAGFTNLDVVRNPSLGSTPYVGRVMLHQTVPLSSEYEDAVKGPLSLGGQSARAAAGIPLGEAEHG